ncbi:MAG: hypothetical protein ACR2LM_17235 [Pyrinomonadaceae bacterium]
MKTRNTFTTALALVALAAGLAVIIAAWQTRQVQAIQDPEDFPSDFGFIDLGAGQTARLNVVNLLRSLPPDPGTPGDPRRARRVRLAFDIYGIQNPDYLPDPSCAIRYRFLRRESCDVVLRPGEAASFDFTAVVGTKVAASTHSLGGPDTREGDERLTPEPHLATTLEVHEGARTIFVVPGVAKGFNPQPDPPGVP